MFTYPASRRDPRCFFRTALLAAGLAAAAVGGLRAQEPGVRHIVINELAPATQTDHAVELYNYGPDQNMNGWQLKVQTGFSNPLLSYNFSSGFILPRHGLVTVHFSIGTDTLTDLYSGGPTQPFATGAGEVLLKNGANSIDFMKFGGIPSPSIQPADLAWIGPSFTWTLASNGLARQHDVNTRSMDDWYQPVSPDGPTPGKLNTKQIGTRLYAPILINEFDRSNSPPNSGKVEIYNPNAFSVNVNGLVLRGGQGATDVTTCATVPLSGTLPAGGTQIQILGGCSASWSSGSAGSIRLRDSATPPNDWDTITFNNAAGSLIMSGTNIHAFRKSDIPTASLSDWTVDIGAATSYGALNPGQQGPFQYDELGAPPTATFNGAANSGAGMQLDFFRSATFKEVRVRMTTSATQAQLAIYRLTGPNSWTRIGNAVNITPVAGVEQVYTTGVIAPALKLNSPATYLVMVFANASFTLPQAPLQERFAYGAATGINTIAGFGAPAGPVGAGGLDGSNAVQFYFWSAPGAAVQPETPALKAGEVNYAYNQPVNSPIFPNSGPPYTWSATGLPAGLSFTPDTTNSQVITGTPTATGSFTGIQVTGTDSNGLTDANSYTLDINPELQWSTPSPLPDGEAGVAYNQTLSATGGAGGNSWSLFSGLLPAGLTLNPGGTITGVPSSQGNPSFTLRVTDSLGYSKDRTFTLNILPAIQITTAALPDADQGSSYNFTLQFSGGAPGSHAWIIVPALGTPPANVTLNGATGLLSGTVSAIPGPNNFTVRVTDSLGGTTTQPLSIKVWLPLINTTASMTDGEEHIPYSRTLTAGGGNGVYTWSQQGGVPGFCTFTPTGTFSCPDPSPLTPPLAVSFTARVTDSAGGVVDKAYNFNFVAAPTISTGILNDGEFGAAYNQTMTVSGGLAPYSWSATGLPPGLGISPGGVITGSPNTPGTYNNISISVTDGPNVTAQKTFNNVVVVPAVQLTTPPGPLGASETGIAFNFSFTAAGGKPGYTFTLDFGTLPLGLSMSTAGVITGTPTLPGGSSLIIRVTDSVGGTDFKTYAIDVSGPPVILNTSLPKGVVQVPYPQMNLIVQGGVPPYNYQLVGGTLPDGINFNLLGAGKFSGTPTTKGGGPLSFQITDSLGGVSAPPTSLPIQVIDPPLPTDWSRRAQFSGGVGQIVLTPGYSDTNAVAFVTADQGGELFRSLDRGITWQPFLVDPSNSGAPIHTLRMTPDFNYGSSGAVFVSTGAGGVYISTDGGATFSSRNTGLPNTSFVTGPQTSALAISPAYPATPRLWVGLLNGAQTQLYDSVDGGVNWNFLAGFAGVTSGITQLEPSPNFASDGTLFAVMDSNVYKSVNGGLNWNICLNNAGVTIKHLVINPGYATKPAVFAEDSLHYFYRSLDGGATWAQLSIQGYNLAFGNTGAGMSALFFKAPGGTYALVKSEDLGDTFVPIYARGMVPTGPVFASALAVGATTGDMFSGTQAGLTVSNDNGNIFFPRQAGLATIKAASISGAGNFVVAATDGGFLRSRDGGLSFVQVQNLKLGDGSVIELPNLSLAAVSPAYANDKTFFLNVTPNFTNTSGLAGSTVVVPGIYRTTDGGFTFSTNPVLPQQCRTVVFAPGFDSRMANGTVHTMYAGCFSGLYRSNDGGASFMPLSGASGMDSRCNLSGQTETDGLGLSVRTDGFYSVYRSGNGGICVSNNSGNNWFILLDGGGAPIIGTISAPASTNADSSTPADRLKLRVNFNDYHIYYSTDMMVSGTTTWTPVKRDATNPLGGIVYARAFFSPNYATDHIALIAVNRSYGTPGGLYRFDASTGIALPLGGADLLRGRVVTGIYIAPGFNGSTGTGVALVTTQGGGVYRSTDGGNTFQPVTRYDFAAPSVRGMSRADGGAIGLQGGGKFIGPTQPASSAGAGTLLAASDDGIYQSDDGGVTFDDISLGLPESTAVLAVTEPSGSTETPVCGVADRGLYRYNGTQWSQDATYNNGNYVNFIEDGSYLYAVRSDGVSLRGDLTGSNWQPLTGGDSDLMNLSYTDTQSFSGPPAKSFGPYLPSGTTASLWGVSATAGPKYSTNSGSTWTATPGGNDYVVPSVSNYQTVVALGLDSVSSARVSLVGYNGGLYRTTDGGDTWRSVTGTGSGLEATTRNATAMISSTTSFGNTDVLVGVSGTATTGGVYLSGDAGEHWTQINSGFDAATLNITSLVKTSCTGCPVQYYSGTYGSGVYTRTVTVNNPPAIPGSNYACWSGTSCSCATAAGSGPEEGGQGFKLCGTGFLSGAVVEFDGIAATGCSVVSATVITCAGTPPHFAGTARVRVRNIDTRAGYLPSSYTYASSSPRVGNTLTVVKSGSNAVLSWASCTGCDASHPARVYRSQSAGFTLYNEQYNTTSLNYTNTGAAATAYSYFWNVE